MKALEQRFRALGLSSYEGKVYAILTTTPEATGPWVARNSCVPLSKVYEVLGRLVEKGFVLISPDSRPRQYKAIAPSLALEAFTSMQQERFNEAKAYLLGRLSKTETQDSERGIWVVRGQEAVDTFINSLLCKAKGSVTLHYADDRQRFKDSLKRIGERGVSVCVRPSAIPTNVLHIDGKELIIFASKREALWIRDPKYRKSKIKPSSSDDGP